MEWPQTILWRAAEPAVKQGSKAWPPRCRLHSEIEFESNLWLEPAPYFSSNSNCNLTSRCVHWIVKYAGCRISDEELEVLQVDLWHGNSCTSAGKTSKRMFGNGNAQTPLAESQTLRIEQAEVEEQRSLHVHVRALGRS